jgi:hypothetical protein
MGNWDFGTKVVLNTQVLVSGLDSARVYELKLLLLVSRF